MELPTTFLLLHILPQKVKAKNISKPKIILYQTFFVNKFMQKLLCTMSERLHKNSGRLGLFRLLALIFLRCVRRFSRNNIFRQYMPAIHNFQKGK